MKTPRIPVGLRTLLLVLITLAVASAQKINTGYDKSVDFSRFKTYAWIPRTAPATEQLFATVIVADIDHELANKGLRKVDSDPDLLVTYYTGTDVAGGFAAQDPGYTAIGGAPLPGGTMWGGSLPATPVPQVMKGTLDVDLVDARQKRLVWRGTAKTKLDYDKRLKMLDQVNNAIATLFKNYPPKGK
jgi:hypothetical protein